MFAFTSSVFEALRLMQLTKKHTILHQNEFLKYSPVINHRCTCVNVSPCSVTHISTSANAAFHVMQRHNTGPLYNAGKTGFVSLTTQ